MLYIRNDLAYARKLTVTGFPVYGSSRLGEKQANKLVYNTSFTISGVDGEGTLLPDSVLLSETELINEAHWHYSSGCDQNQLLTFYINDMVIERIKHAAQPRAKLGQDALKDLFSFFRHIFNEDDTDNTVVLSLGSGKLPDEPNPHSLPDQNLEPSKAPKPKKNRLSTSTKYYDQTTHKEQNWMDTIHTDPESGDTIQKDTSNNKTNAEEYYSH